MPVDYIAVPNFKVIHSDSRQLDGKWEHIWFNLKKMVIHNCISNDIFKKAQLTSDCQCQNKHQHLSSHDVIPYSQRRQHWLSYEYSTVNFPQNESVRIISKNNFYLIPYKIGYKIRNIEIGLNAWVLKNALSISDSPVNAFIDLLRCFISSCITIDLFDPRNFIWKVSSPKKHMAIRIWSSFNVKFHTMEEHEVVTRWKSRKKSAKIYGIKSMIR